MQRLGLLLLLLSVLALPAQAQRSPQELYEGQVPAPAFPAGLDWINVEQPLTMEGLLGKIVILDFWTYGCINCLHIIPILEQVEQKFAEEVVVIGVHSAKFENEGQTENLRQIVQRYGVHHPVVNDSDFSIWRTYGVQAWPTVAIIEPLGNVVIRQSGEIPFETFDAYLSGMVAYYDSEYPGSINRTALELALEGAGDPGTPLLYPGKVLADSASQRLFIADSSHNRIVIADRSSGEVLDIIGSSRRGFVDDSFEGARFDKPQGMALAGNMLYIADVNNHAIRMADLAARTVLTVAGNGSMGRGRLEFGTRVDNPLGVALRSPWDIEFDEDGRLHIAMAGTHQLYIYEPAQNLLYPSVGNGREANLNGVSLADSELAQPSGLYYAGEGKLYFADSESSTIRLADFANDLVTVVAGTTENSLFDYGDIDGELGVNRLQHALGVEGLPKGDILIADTYNSRIKILRAGQTGTETLLGLGGLGGYANGDASVAEFDEPGGISYADGVLYVADTNNHVIRRVHLDTGLVDTFEFSNPAALAIPDRYETTVVHEGGTAEILLDEQVLATGENSISLHINFPPEYKINPLINSELAVAGLSTVVNKPVTTVPIAIEAGSGELAAELTLYYCREGAEALCFIETAAWRIPYNADSRQAAGEIELALAVTVPDL